MPCGWALVYYIPFLHLSHPSHLLFYFSKSFFIIITLELTCCLEQNMDARENCYCRSKDILKMYFGSNILGHSNSHKWCGAVMQNQRKLLLYPNAGWACFIKELSQHIKEKIIKLILLIRSSRRIHSSNM